MKIFGEETGFMGKETGTKETGFMGKESGFLTRQTEETGFLTSDNGNQSDFGFRNPVSLSTLRLKKDTYTIMNTGRGLRRTIQ